MSRTIIVVLLAVTIYLLFKAIFILRVKRLKSATDDQFVHEFLIKYPTAKSQEILKARKIVARYFGLPAKKITVGLNLSDLSSICTLFPNYSLAINDIVYDLYESDNKKDMVNIVIPETAEELVDIFIHMKNGHPSYIPKRTKQGQTTIDL